MMKYKDLKHLVGQMTEAELEEPVLVFNPYYNRTFTTTSIDHIESFKSGQQLENDKLAIIIYNGQ